VNENENLFAFTYDWRLDIRTNADKLKTFIENVRNQTGSSTVDIVAHSMGGLIAKSYIAKYTAAASNIRRLIFIATPHLGQPEMNAILTNGYIEPSILPSIYWILNTDDVQYITENMPSAYQLLPSRGYMNIYPTPLQIPVVGDPFNQSLAYLKSNTFWLNNHVLNSKLINAVDGFQTSLNLLDFGSILVFNIVGTDIHTVGKLYPYSVLGGIKLSPRFNIIGDGTVPLGSAETISGHSTIADYYILKKNNKDYSEHQKLPSSPPVTEIVRGLLSDPIKTSGWTNAEYISTTPPGSKFITSFYQVTGGSPIELHAYDSLERHTGPTSDTTWEANIPGSTYIPGNLKDRHSSKTIMLPDSFQYRIVIKGQDTVGTFDLMLVNFIDSVTTKEAMFKTVAINPTTTAVCSLTTVSGSLLLSIDKNGDGTIDTTVTPNDFVVTGVGSEKQVRPIPTSYNLRDAYPNPFNPSTTMRFDLPYVTHTRLQIFDMLGRVIATLVDETKQAGSYEVTWNASNISSGVYFYRLQAGSFVETKKLLLIR
jgi:hypothetical protein